MHGAWSDFQLVHAVAEAGSLTGAAKLLRVTQPTISRQLAELEARLGEPLFSRAAAGARLTAFGERMLEPLRRMADAAREAAEVASGADTQPRGAVRITAPPGIAFEFIAPFAARVAVELPEIRIEAVSSVAYLDIARREADLAVRNERLDRASGQRDLVTLASVEFDVVAYAAPNYVARLPKKYGIADVGWIGWPPPLEHLPPNPQLAALIPGFRPVFTSNDFLVQMRAAEAGVGAIPLGRIRSPHAVPTTLVELALPFGAVRSSMQLVGARSSLAIPRVRAVAERLADELSRAPHQRAPRAKGLAGSAVPSGKPPPRRG
jgi:DNA-binding transcriptional LysR family regulator